MAIQFAAAVTSFVICFLIIPVIIKYSLEKNLVDIPGRRKIHKKITPSMGGIAIFLGFIIASIIWIDLYQLKEVRFVPMALFIVFFVGVRDDLVPLRPVMKVLGQVMAACLLIFLFDLRLRSLYGLLGIYDIPFIVSFVITTFTIIVVTNSFNLIDGLDGLAGTLASVTLTAFGISFFLIDDIVFATLSFGMLGAVIAFLFFNWQPSKIFMGDTGALVIGMMLSILAIHFIDSHHALPDGHPYKFDAGISGAVCFIIVPLADTLRIFILRLTRKQSPFKPDKSHIHHNFVRLGFSHGGSTIFLSLIQLGFILLGFFGRNLNDNYLLLAIFILCVFLSIAMDKVMEKKLVQENVE
jgi:UDP-N-acetylmuramyl pentapeptide phosphotransferase/UDP-N-acetylglucosamine-1-phosphate transferase